jgi:hypothetical protein
MSEQDEIRRILQEHREGPPKRRELMRVVAESHRIVGLFDPDDTPVVKCSEVTWRNATELLMAIARWFREAYATDLDVPSIQLGPKGSVDLHWDLPAYKLLVNVPSSGGPCRFYVDNRGLLSVEGTIRLKTS